MQKISYDLIKEVVYKEVLDNGLKVVLVPKKDYNKTYAIIGTKYGSIDNRFIPVGKDKYIDVPSGIAHFLEHKLFEMEDGIDASVRLSNLGVTSNAYTTFDRTAYLFTASNNVKEALNELLDFVFNPYFTDENILKEQGIIDQEINMYLDDPYFNAINDCMRNMYKENSVNLEIVGTTSSIKKIDKDILYTCYNTFYQPGNMCLALVGNFDEDIIDVIKENMSKKTFPSYKEIKREYKLDDTIGDENTTSEMDVSIPKVCIGVRLPIIEFDLKFDSLLAMVMTYFFSESSKYVTNLTKKRLINDTFSSFSSVDFYANYVMLLGDSNKPLELVSEIKKIFDEIKESKVNKRDFNRIKNALLGSFVSSFNSVEAIGGNIIKYELNGEDFFNITQILEDISFEEFKDSLNIFNDAKIVSHIIYPKNE